MVRPLVVNDFLTSIRDVTTVFSVLLGIVALGMAFGFLLQPNATLVPPTPYVYEEPTYPEIDQFNDPWFDQYEEESPLFEDTPLFEKDSDLCDPVFPIPFEEYLDTYKLHSA